MFPLTRATHFGIPDFRATAKDPDLSMVQLGFRTSRAHYLFPRSGGPFGLVKANPDFGFAPEGSVSFLLRLPKDLRGEMRDPFRHLDQGLGAGVPARVEQDAIFVRQVGHAGLIN